jgi:putative FmdB family regulatory protein
MPIYEYICDTCHDEFEIRRSFSDEGVPPCPRCNGTGQVHRKFSAPAIVFKGKGFYVTDSRGKSSTSTPAASTSSKESNSNDGDKKTAAPEKKSSESKTSSAKES